MQDGFAWSATAVQYDDQRFVALEHQGSNGIGDHAAEVTFAVDLPASSARELSAALHRGLPASTPTELGPLILAVTTDGFLIAHGGECGSLTQADSDTLVKALDDAATTSDKQDSTG